MQGTKKQIETANAIKDQFLNGQFVNGQRFSKGVYGYLEEAKEDLDYYLQKEDPDEFDQEEIISCQNDIAFRNSLIELANQIGRAEWWDFNASHLLAGTTSMDSVKAMMEKEVSQ